jgi:hypothetical protein
LSITIIFFLKNPPWHGQFSNCVKKDSEYPA